MMIALVEMRFAVTQGWAPWVYLLLIGAGIVRPAVRARGPVEATREEARAPARGAPTSPSGEPR
jgi:hypothetical protein